MEGTCGSVEKTCRICLHSQCMERDRMYPCKDYVNQEREKNMSDAKVRCIIKRPDEQYGHVTNISTSLKNLQKIVGGPIETVACGGSSVIICNEEGKIRGLEPNFRIGSGWLADVIVGEAIVIGTDGEDFCDLPISFDVWKKLLKGWGNK